MINWTNENIEKLRELRSEEKTYDEIAIKFQTTVSSIKNACRRNNIRLTSRKKWSDEDIKKLRKLKSEGKTYEELASKFKKTVSSIVNTCRRYEIK